MKTLTLKKSVWKCGMNALNPENKMGEGITSLLNKSEYMCCLGQFSLQLNTNLTKNDIWLKGSPAFVNVILSLSYLKKGKVVNTKLSEKAIKINDDESTTIDEKIKKLKSIFSKNGYKIIVEE